jgi:hypothetical protein
MASDVAAYRDVCGTVKRRRRNSVFFSYDLRNRLNKPVGDVFCIFGSAFKFKFNYNSKKSFWENVQTFHRSTRKKLDARAVVLSEQIMNMVDPTFIEALRGGALQQKYVPERFRRDKLPAFVRDKGNIAQAN